MLWNNEQCLPTVDAFGVPKEKQTVYAAQCGVKRGRKNHIIRWIKDDLFMRSIDHLFKLN